MTDDSTAITVLLRRWGQGDTDARDRLIPLVHDELHRLACRYMTGERENHTLQPTALVNEAYLRLIQIRDVTWQDRTHFVAVSARVMRRILVDFARARKSEKRGADAPMVTLDDDLPVSNDPDADILALDDALQALAALDERKSRVIELRFFGGLSVEETAAALEISPASVMRDWRLAKAWLSRELVRRRD